MLKENLTYLKGEKGLVACNSSSLCRPTVNRCVAIQIDELPFGILVLFSLVDWQPAFIFLVAEI